MFRGQIPLMEGISSRTQLIILMRRLKVPNGLGAIGYTGEDIPALVDGTLPQHRVIKLSPRPVGREEFAQLFRKIDEDMVKEDSTLN